MFLCPVDLLILLIFPCPLSDEVKSESQSDKVNTDTGKKFETAFGEHVSLNVPWGKK